MKVSMLKAKSMGKAPSLLLMEACTLVTFSTTKSQEKEDTTGQMARLMKDNGIKIRCMDMECLCGKMERSTKDTL